MRNSAGERSGATRRKRQRDLASAAEVVDFDRYVPSVVARFMSKLRASSTEFFTGRYGLSIVEWRIISFIAAEGPASAYEIWTIGSLDKAAVSRAIRALKERGLISVRELKSAPRRKTQIDLTQRGRDLHATTFSEIVLRHERLVNGLTAAEIETFLKAIAYLEKRIALMDNASVDAPSGFSITKPAPARGAR